MKKTEILFNPSILIKETEGLTVEERGVFYILISIMIEQGKPLENAISVLLNHFARDSEKALYALESIIKDGVFIETENGLWHTSKAFK